MAEKSGDRVTGPAYCVCPPRSVVTFKELVTAICPQRKRGQRGAVIDWLRARGMKYFLGERGQAWTMASALEDALGRRGREARGVNLEPPPRRARP